MRHTPRALNRTLIFLAGVLLLGIGALLAAAGTLENVRETWLSAGETSLKWLTAQFHLTPMDLWGKHLSSLWLLALAALAVLVVLAIAWIGAQSTPRAHQLRQVRSEIKEPAEVVEPAAASSHKAGVLSEGFSLGTEVASQLVRQALASDPRILSVQVSAWPALGHRASVARARLRHHKSASVLAGLHIKVRVRKGSPPKSVADAVERYIGALDEVIEAKPVVVVQVKAGARSSFASQFRVE